MRRPVLQWLSARDGVAAVEFAIVFPVFLLMMLGILAYGLYFAAAHSLAQLASDAARASVAGLSDDERAAIVRDHVRSAASGYAFIQPASVEVETGSVPGTARQFRIVLRYDASDLPIWQMDPLLPLPARTIERRIVVVKGGY